MYFLLTEFKVRTVSYQPSCFPLRDMDQVRSTWVIYKSTGKNEVRTKEKLQYGPKRQG